MAAAAPRAWVVFESVTPRGARRSQAAMDRELRTTTIAHTFEGRGEYEQDEGPDSDDEDGGASGGEVGAGDGDLLPLDLDMNLVMNMLRSVEGQDGGGGPAGNILGELGVVLGAVEAK